MRKKLHLFLMLFVAMLISVSASADGIPAFPGAEGFGRFAKGVRTSATPEVYHVTNLDDSGPGSLRDAVSKSGRIVVFDVAGVIQLKSRLVFSGDSYVAGQTAPGDGVILYGNGVSFTSADNLIVRYLRIHMGKGGDTGKDASGIANGTNMIFDHMSIMWGLDENFSVNWDGKGSLPADITIQNSIIGQGIETHSCGGLIQTEGGVSIIGCLYIDNKTRNPKVKGLNQFINNVVYNWGEGGGYILGDSEGNSWGWIEGNYFIKGPSTGNNAAFVRANNNFQLYYKDNIIDSNLDGALNGDQSANNDYGPATFVTDLHSFTAIPKLHPTVAGGILSAEDAYKQVLAQCGAILPVRSFPDRYVIDELTSLGLKGELIANENENGIYQNVGIVCQGTKPVDTDGDGIPDEWEDQNGLDKNNAADAIQIAANGYLNIENYINSISAPVAPYVRCASNIEMEDRTINSIQLKWINNAVQSDQVLLQHSTDGINFMTIATLAANTTSYNVTALSEETVYYFRIVTKMNGLPDSTPSEILEVATAGQPKAPYSSTDPTPAIDGTSRFYTEVPFIWKNTTGPWAGNVTYEVFFGTSADQLTCIASDLSEKQYVFKNAGLTMGDTYYWRVDAKNDRGVTPGTVWSFKAGTYSFISSYVDLGIDYEGTKGTGEKINAQSGTLLNISSRSYTVHPETSDEMDFALSGGAMNNSSNNVYDKSGAVVCFYLNSSSSYLEGSLTSGSSSKLIASVQVNGTSPNVGESDVTRTAILYSDAYPFDATSVIGYEEFELPPCRSGNSGVTLTAPVGSKSFRIYQKVTISPSEDNEDIYVVGGTYNTLGGLNNPRIAYLGVTLELVSNDGEQEDSPDNTIRELTINGKKAVINNKDKTVTCSFLKGTVLVDWPVAFSLNSSFAQADFVSGNSHNFAGGPLSIEVTAQNGDKAIYTVSATVNDQTMVGMLTANGAAESYDDLFLSAFRDYHVEFLDAGAEMSEDIRSFYDGYDLIVLHSNVSGTNSIGLATREMVGVKPILNMKAFFYNSGRWDWSSGKANNTEAGRTSCSVEAPFHDHPVFENVNIENEELTLYGEPTSVANAFQYVGIPDGTNWTTSMSDANHTLATIDGDPSKVIIHELNLRNEAKYLLIGLSMEGDSYLKFNDNAVRMISNAAAYLLDSEGYYDYSITGIDENVFSGFYYSNGYIYNPNQEKLMVFSIMGTPVLSSSESFIDARHLVNGLYIIKGKDYSVKFIR